ncbi:MAG: hypothetical protein JXB47_15315, partial [Anaerolineae bacterium]|nr:hypothetical protein [Anaerolineae bacterium]
MSESFHIPRRPLEPTDLARYTWQIYARHIGQWLAFGVLLALPTIVMSFVSVTAFTPLQDTLFKMAIWEGGDISSAEVERVLLDFFQQFTTVFTVMCGLGTLVGVFQLLLYGAGVQMAGAAYKGQRVAVDAAVGVAVTERGLALIGGYLFTGLVLGALGLVSSVLVICCIGVIGLLLGAYLALAWLPMLGPVL